MAQIRPFFEMATPSITMVAALLVLLPLIVTLWFRHQSKRETKQPPRLSETIPFVSNAWQFMTNKGLFITRAREALKTSPIVQCRLGPMNLHLVTGGSNVSAIFRSSFTSEPWILRIMEYAAGYAPSDLAKIAADDSGGTTLSRPGSKSSPGTRIWHGMHRMYDDTMLSARAVETFATVFQSVFNERIALEAPVVGAWTEDVHIYEFLRQNMALAATHASLGPLILEVNPDFIEAFWQYEKHVEKLAFGLPTWLNQSAVRARDRLGAMCRKWYDVADARFDWDSVDPKQYMGWEPVFGSPVSRGLAQWAKTFHFTAETLGPVYVLLLFGLHANTIPVCAWVLMELIKDPDLWRAVKEEISQAETTIDENDTKRPDYRKLATLPLLQSVYTEVLRLHVGILITRTSIEPVTIGGYTVPKGTVFQAPTEVAHLDEDIWGKPGYPATEFWAYRHVKQVEIADKNGHITKHLEFSLGGRPGYFFPFGGGFSICAGRNLAKPEVFLTVAEIVSRFEVEFVGWLKENGSSSDRAAINDKRYANAVAAPPDREMKVRWRRLR